MSVHSALWICLAFFSLAAFAGGPVSRASLSTGPCSEAGQREISLWNRIGKPARGSIDELGGKLDPKRPLKPQLSSIDDPGLHADQCRAVLGPLPHVNCLDGVQVPVTHDGKIVTYDHGVLAEDGKPVDPKVLYRCDTPELLPFLILNPKNHPPGKGNFQGCVPNVRIGHVKSGPVDWVFLCHYHSGLHEPTNDQFDFVAMIGSNALTGETCFFAHDQGKTSGTDVPTPGGPSPEERARAAVFWNHPSRNTCVRCHANNKPWAVTPYVRQSRLGGDGSMDFIPEVPLAKRLTPNWGYRIIGSVHNLVMARPKLVWPRNDDGSVDNTCVRCHLLSDRTENLRLVREAVGLKDLPDYESETFVMPRTRSAWMPPSRLEEGAKGLHRDGTLAPDKFVEAALRFQRAARHPEFRAREVSSLSECPAPARLSASAVTISPGHLHWKYRNDYGEVPTRDDVRFAVTIEGSDGSRCEVRDVAPRGLGSAAWDLRLPVRKGVRYSYRLEPYRYCFDRDAYRGAGKTSVGGEGAE